MTATSPHPTVVPRSPTVLVTGASGNLGREVVTRLRARRVRVRCFGRTATDEGEWAVGDLTDPRAFGAALRGIDAVVLTWPLLDSAPAHDVVARLVEADVRVVYVSSSAIEDGADEQSDPITRVHAELETALRTAGLRSTVLRSDTMASNARGWIGQLRAGDVVSGPDIAATAVVDERDVARAVVSVLLAEDGHIGPGPHVLTGPRVLDRAEQVACLAAALGRPLRFEAVAAVEARRRMLADGRPAALVDALIAAAENRPRSTRVTDIVERLTGRSAGGFERWAEEHVDEFGTDNVA